MRIPEPDPDDVDGSLKRFYAKVIGRLVLHLEAVVDDPSERYISCRMFA